MLTILHHCLLALGLLIGLPLLAFLFLILKTPISSTGILYLLSYFLIVVGMICAPWWTRRSLGFILAGSAIVLTTVIVRIMFPPLGTRVHMVTLPSQAGPRPLNRILNEQDVVLFGTQVSPYIGFISRAEQESLIPEFSKTFVELSAQGATPLSPFLTTYLNLQQPNGFDTVVAEPKSGSLPTKGIIFLHGFGGNFTVQCWLIAKAGQRMDALTVCPSTGPNGSWWDSQSQSILEQTLTYLHQRGVEQVYLAGLSNGAIATSRLADTFRNRLAGLILISGADPAATITQLPVLVLHGKYDERIPVSLMEKFVSAAGPNATYYMFESDHFLLLKKADQIQGVIADWLNQQELNVQIH